MSRTIPANTIGVENYCTPNILEILLPALVNEKNTLVPSGHSNHDKDTLISTHSH